MTISDNVKPIKDIDDLMLYQGEFFADADGKLRYHNEVKLSASHKSPAPGGKDDLT